MTPTTDPRLASAVSMREAGRDEEARLLLLDLRHDYPEDARVNLQCAWVHDKLGLEREAVPFYEEALAGGLEGDDLCDALLGLGSTYRAIGDYPRALATLLRGVKEFPDHRGLQVFLAMALYNSGNAKRACELLLATLAETSADPTITRYRPALRLYADDLDRTW